MSYPKRLLRLNPQRGFIADTAPHAASPEFWTRCLNVQFRDGFATRLPGFRNAYSDEIDSIAPDEFYHTINADRIGLNWWIAAQRDGTVHAFNAGTVVQIDNGLLAPVNEPWEYSSALINGIPLLSNGRSEPAFWGGGAAMERLPGWPANDSCQFLAVLKFHVFALNISGSGGSFESLLKWSAATEPGTVPSSWLPQPDNDAGSVELADSPGPLLCAWPLGDTLLIYKRGATYQARYIGGNSVYSFRKIQSSSGTLAPRSVCDVGGAHFVVADGDIILNDGTTRKSIGESRVKQWLFDQLDSDQFNQLFCVYNRAKEEVIVGFPSNGSRYCDSALIYDLSRDSFGVRSLDQVTHAAVGLVRDQVPDNTWANRIEPWINATDVWARQLGATAVDSLVTLKAVVFSQEDENTGTLLNAVIGRSGLDFGEPERLKFVKRVHIKTQKSFGELRVKVGGQMRPNSPIDWSDEIALRGDQQIVDAFAMGRYIAIEINSTDNVPWKLTGIEIEAELRGYH